MPSSPAIPASVQATKPEVRAAGTVASAVLLAFVGGTLDAFLYLNHGHVFAGAMTGNAVLCGVALLSHDLLNFVHHALPLLAYVCGVWAAEVLQTRIRHHAITLALGCEAVGLLVASFLPGSFPDPLFVFLIAFVAAFQVASFRKANTHSYNSTFITGDLRQVVVGFYEALNTPERTKGLRQGRDLGLIVIGFILGAMIGALLSPRWANRTLWLPCALVLVVFLVALRRSLHSDPAHDPRA